MILDKISNVRIYKNIPSVVVDFFANNHELGHYDLADGIWANVEQYQTKNIEIAKYESHKDYIDIQYLQSGHENIYIEDVVNLTLESEYDKNRDIQFFKDKVKAGCGFLLDGSNFLMIFPHEAHAPQVADTVTESLVTKFVVKIKKGLVY